jgi:Tetratricopeptide repeat
MRKTLNLASVAFASILLWLLVSCKNNGQPIAKEAIDEINLKKGQVVVCGPADKQFGSVGTVSSCSEKVQKDFNLAIALLHSFEYDEAEKVFAKIIDSSPGCAMAYWGVAMSNYHPLWTPPTPSELEKGAKAIHIAQSLPDKSKKESEYIEAIASFYENRVEKDHRTRSLSFMNAMEKMYTTYPDDEEVAIFYSLSLIATADPSDKTYKNQKKAGKILESLNLGQANHPGLIHYIIHTYDLPELAELALPAARKYASVAPSSAHALHMPSHIFIRLGLWDESINSNLASVASAKCYAEQTGIKGHWEEEIHGLDYLVYAYLQKGENNLASKQLDYLKRITEVQMPNFKVAYAYASIPSRIALENKSWEDAAELTIPTVNVSWKDFPWQKSILHFTRLLGSVHTGKLDSAKAELKYLKANYETLMNQKKSYEANQVLIQIKSSEAWILLKEGKNEQALTLMEAAADMEDKTEKHPVTPGEVIPARELLGDMLIQMNKPAEALKAYEADLKKHPGRFNGLYGAAIAAEKSNNPQKANQYYQQLVVSANATGSNRPELEKARLYLKKGNI